MKDGVYSFSFSFLCFVETEDFCGEEIQIGEAFPLGEQAECEGFVVCAGKDVGVFLRIDIRLKHVVYFLGSIGVWLWFYFFLFVGHAIYDIRISHICQIRVNTVFFCTKQLTNYNKRILLYIIILYLKGL